MSQGDINTAINTPNKYDSKHKVQIPPAYMQHDPQHKTMTYIHYDLQPYKEVDVYQQYQNNYKTQTDPLHTEELDNDEESIPSLLCPGEYEDFDTDDEESVDGHYNDIDHTKETIPPLLERGDDSDSEDEDSISELEIPTAAIYDKPQSRGIPPTVIRKNINSPNHEEYGQP